MAAVKKNRSKPDDPLFRKTREKIKVGLLVNRLEKNALGTLTKNSGKKKGKNYKEIPTEMTASQLRSAEILLDRTMARLSRTEIGGVDGSSIDTSLKVTFVTAGEVEDLPKDD